MRKDILIKVDTKTSRVILPTDTMGITGENVQGKLMFELDEFIDGVATLLIHQEFNNEQHDYYVQMNKEDKLYTLEIKNSLLKGWKVDLQLKITEAEANDSIPVFKSNKFFLKVEPTIESNTIIPDEYPTWIETANATIAEMNNLMKTVDENVSGAVKSVDDKLEELDEAVASGEFNGDSITNAYINENGELIVVIDKVVE